MPCLVRSCIAASTTSSMASLQTSDATCSIEDAGRRCSSAHLVNCPLRETKALARPVVLVRATFAMPVSSSTDQSYCCIWSADRSRLSCLAQTSESLVVDLDRAKDAFRMLLLKCNRVIATLPTSRMAICLARPGRLSMSPCSARRPPKLPRTSPAFGVASREPLVQGSLQPH